MFRLYRRIWTAGGVAPPSNAVLALLLLFSVVWPLTAGLSPHWHGAGIAALAFAGCAVGLVLFFNLGYFAVYLFPLVYALAIHRILLALSILFAVSFLADRLRSGRFCLLVAHPAAIFILLVAGLNGVAQAYDRDLGRYCFQYTIIIPLLIFLIYYNMRPDNRQIRANLFAVCLVAAIIGWISLGMYIQSGVPRRIFGWPTTNMAANFFGMLLPVAVLSLVDARRGEKRLIWMFIFAGVLAGIFVTQTRAIIVSGLVSILYLGWKDRRVLKVIFPAILIAVVAAPTLILFRLAMMVGRGVEPDWSAVGRIQIWLNSLHLIPHYFLFGMGFESFRFIYPARFPTGFIRAQHVHNNYLRWLFELGIVGMIAYATFVFSVLRRALRPVAAVKRGKWGEEERILLGINAGVIGTLISALVDTPLASPPIAVLFWTFLAYQLVLTARLKERIDQR